MTEEEKEKLIELSDLNREDNVKYISSEAQGIAITLDSDRYAPTLCKLERAYICGRRKSENRITELEKENAELKERADKAKDIIKGLYFIIQDRIDYENNIGIADEMWRAEQFFKEVKEKGINTVPLSDVYVVDSGDHGVSEDYYDIMELSSPACPKLFSDERKERIDVDIALDNTTDQLTYAKTIIQDLLDNTDEYARQRAEDFLKENK